MKKCIKCGVEKPLDEFPVRKDSLDGRRNECNCCKKVIDAERYQKCMSVPGAKEAEALRIMRLRESMTEEDKANKRDRQNALNRTRAVQEKANFIATHGCTKQELKYTKDKIEFVADAISRNGDRYDYSEVEYQGVWHPVKITCNKHKLSFVQTPKSHRKGSGCPDCAKEATGNALRKTQEQFIKDAQALCGDKYTYERVEYVSNMVLVQVTCPTHGDFPIRPGNLLSGKGCPACSNYGFRSNLPGKLYVLRNEELTKIGITNKEVAFRLKQLNKKGKNFSLCGEYSFDNGREAADLETLLLNLFRETHLQPAEKFDGSTECFYQLEPEHVTSVIDSILNNKEHNGYRRLDGYWETSPSGS